MNDSLMVTDDVLKKAEAQYHAKVKSGKYDHYTAEMLVLLFEDCIRETACREAINSRGERNGHLTNV